MKRPANRKMTKWDNQGTGQDNFMFQDQEDKRLMSNIQELFSML